MAKLPTFHDKILKVDVFLKLDNVVHNIKDKVAEIKVHVPKHEFFTKASSKSFEESFESALKSASGKVHTIDTEAMIIDEFTGIIEGSSGDLDGKYLYAKVSKGKNFTAILTAIKDPSSLRPKIHGEQNGSYDLIKDALPSSEKDISSFQLLIISKEGKHALIINDKNKDVAQRTMQTIIQIELGKKGSS